MDQAGRNGKSDGKFRETVAHAAGGDNLAKNTVLAYEEKKHGSKGKGTPAHGAFIPLFFHLGQEHGPQYSRALPPQFILPEEPLLSTEPAHRCAMTSSVVVTKAIPGIIRFMAALWACEFAEVEASLGTIKL